MKGILKKVEALISGRGIDQYEFAARQVKSTTVESKDGRADFISESESMSYSIRVIKGKGMGYSFAVSGGEEELSSMVEGAIFAAKFQDEDDFAVLPEGPQKYPDLSPLRVGTSVPLEVKAAYAVELERLARKADRRIKTVRYATLKDSTSRFFIFNSNGVEGEYASTLYMAFIYAVAEEKGQSETGFGLGFSGSFEAMGEMQGNVANEATGKALRMLGARGIKTGRYPVIVENGAMADLLGVLSHSLNGHNVALGKSMLASSRGRDVFSEKITVVDDPLMDDGAGSCPFDGEGVSSRKLSLIERGRCREFLADSYWGGKIGTGTTGSLRRGSFKNPPHIGISNMYFMPGERGLQEMIDSAGEGVLLSSFLGIHTADTISGDFSVGASGLFFEKGAIKYPVRTFAVSGNIVEFMGRVQEVGSDLKMYGSSGSPSIAFEYIDIGGD